MKRVTLLLLLSAWLYADPTPEELLRVSDRSRGGIESGLQWEIEIKTSEDGHDSVRLFDVLARDSDALATATAPARNKGEIFLFNHNSLWFFKPGLRKPVGISSRQKLTGQTANGDIASTHYFRDYTGKIKGSDTIDGQPTYQLDLVAKDKSVTYDRILYWISKTSKLGIKAEFLSLEGQPLKKAAFSYDNTLVVKNETIPFLSRMTISDAKNPSQKSILIYQKPKVINLNPILFDVNHLVR